MLNLTRYPPRPNRSSAQAGPAITVESIGKSYAGRFVVDDVSLSVERGEIFGLLGANGAGKTTAVECIQGLRQPDRGTVRVLGIDPGRENGRLGSAVGSQLQESFLPDRLRVGEAVALFDRCGRRDIVGHLEPWGLADQVKTSFADLSGGQRQRLFIVLALLNDPEVVFLDELTQGLDPSARRDVWRVIREIGARGTTILLVSHFAEEIETLCDRVAIMANGRIVDTGTPRAITDRHAERTTVSFNAPLDYDRSVLARLAGVERLEENAGRLTVYGASRMIAAVCATTVDDGTGPNVDLQVRHPTLDDALVNLIGSER